jgi:predicted small integral membrane protein
MDNTSITSWMAWTWPTAFFFIFVFGCIAGMGVWEYYVPGGSPRHGIFGLDTTRGDRLFLSAIDAHAVALDPTNGRAQQLQQMLERAQ